MADPLDRAKPPTSTVVVERGLHAGITVKDGDVIEGNGWTIECVYTPGALNHMCFALLEEKALFTGDHVMGWSTSVIGPPDGDMTAYMSSLEKLLAGNDRVRNPAPVSNAKPFVQAFIDHQLDRDEFWNALITVSQHTRNGRANVYETDPRMYPAARQSVLSAMIDWWI